MIEQLRQQFQREAAEQAEADAARDAARQARRRRWNPSRFRTLSAISPIAIINLPRFTLILTVWGAALFGFSVLALSSVDIARVSMVLGLGALGHFAQIVYAAIAALIGAVGAFGVAQVLVRFVGGSRSRGPVAMLAAERVRPIEPEELGSDSLDAPIEELPFIAPCDEKGETDAERDKTLTAPEADSMGDAAEDTILELDALSELDDAVEEAFEEEQAAIEEADEEDTELVKPVAPGLNIDAFHAILEDENRKANALEQEAREQEAKEPASLSALLPTSGIEKLRQTPPQDLSLIQLVERFAAALHDVQDRSAHELTGERLANENAARERALAEALKALELFTDRGFEDVPSHPDAGEAATINETERDLQDALTKLQSLRGAA